MNRIFIVLCLFISCPTIAGEPLRDEATENLFNALRQMSSKGYTMFGMANAFTIGYNETKNNKIADSDIRDVVGDNPAFVESDFMWYSDTIFKEWDLEAMRKAHDRGAILGYCWHLAGPQSGTFYIGEKGKYSADYNLVEKILSNDNRLTNRELDWYLSKLDSLVIPVFRDLGFPLVFRPFHEMTGAWFWWGSLAGAENYKKLFRLTVDYLRQAGIRNVLYCWSPDKEADFSFYPGDDYIDILGYDAYEPGLKPYITQDKLVREIGKLVEYADSHNKVAAWTEVGLRSETEGVYEYPTNHPDFWTEYVWNVVKKNPQTNRLAWIMTWYNADWSRSGKGAPYVPYKGMDKKGSDKAVADFYKLYLENQSLFEGDMPDMDGNKKEQSIFIVPKTPVLKQGETIVLLGGSRSAWFTEEKKRWKSSNPEVAFINPQTGELKALSVGKTIVSVESDGRSASVQVVILP